MRVLSSVIVLGAVPFLPSGRIRVAAFVPLTHPSKARSSALSPPPETRTGSSLPYGPRDDGDEGMDVAAPSSPFSASDFLRRTNDEPEPCSVDDEDCLAFSSLDGRRAAPLVFHPKTYLRSDIRLAADLERRSNSIRNIRKERIDRNWRTAHCPTTFVPVSDSDRVRQVHMDAYPVAVCGGARGGLYVMDLEEGRVIARAEGAHAVRVERRGGSVNAATAKRAVEDLCGELDGGGTLCVAVRGDLVASAGREGGAKLWRIVRSEDETTEGELVPLGSIPGLERTIVTSLEFGPDDLLWAGCYDGTVRAYDVAGRDDPAARFPPRGSVFRSDFTGPVLDMNLCPELGLGVCATADGGASLFRTDDGQFLAGIVMFEGAARSALIVKHRNDEGCSILCGGADGVIHRIPLNIDAKTRRVDEEDPFAVSDTTATALGSRHTGPVMCMASRGDGMFVSGGQDGEMRVWDCSPEDDDTEDDDGVDAIGGRGGPSNRPTLRTKCMYALTEYEPWLGSVCTDGERLVSDGGENSIIIRDFSCEPGAHDEARSWEV